MATIKVHDKLGLLNLGGTHNLSFLRALILLAQATAPSPRSRYRPTSRWAIAKYLTVCDPRRRGGAAAPFIVNPGIKDLDPHQKGVLSDDIGVAIALGLLDETHGIIGLADVYALHSSGLLILKSPGKHRKMPDYVIELRKPIANSHTVLLECKGSITPYQFKSQLKTACKKQLKNVKSVHGTRASSIPKIAAATELALGAQAEIHLDDPLELIQPLSNKLRANFLALEYALFGDLRSANEIWNSYGLPTFSTTAFSNQLPSEHLISSEDSAMTALLQADDFTFDAQGQFELNAESRIGYAMTRLHLEMSSTAKKARLNQAWSAALSDRKSIQQAPAFSSELKDEEDGNQRQISEEAATSIGIKATSKMEVWYNQ